MVTVDKSELLKKYFGHSSFRQGQGEIIDSILSGRDCLGVMPTGAGKSICFQIPALMLDGVTIVISPLISLMKDQVEALTQSGVSAAYINSTLSAGEYQRIFERTAAGGCRILYVAPERLLTEDFLGLCAVLEIPLVAVDESHCVSHWGQDFRPSYLKIPEFIAALKKRPVLAAFTATATDTVKADIVKILGLKDPFSVTTGFDRQNLYFEVRKPRDKDEELLSILRGASGGSTIVYCSTRKNVESVCCMLCDNGFNAEMYHAGMADRERKRTQEDFIYDRVGIMVATNAFGMGIDKSDVSLVVHYNMPKDLESYYQEAGRAGRDGGPARCILLYSGRDVNIAEFLIENSHEDSELSPRELAEIRKRDRERLRQMTFYSTTTGCLREFILKYFGDKSPNYCGNCSNCVTKFETVDVTVEAQKILSCIFRLKQRGRSSGRVLIADILLGSRSEKILQGSLDKLSTYGLLKGGNRSRIISIIDFLVREEYIEIEPEHSTCQLTRKADEFVKSRATLLMKLPKEEAEKDKPKQTYEENTELMKLLKQERFKLASAMGVPAYVVFSDASLREMSAKMPVTEEEFLKISGVGSRKAERYGKTFMGIIKDFKQEEEINGA